MKILIIPTLLLLTSMNLLGQETIEISGRVISKRGNYCPGTNVILHGTIVGAATDACGQFKIRIPKDREGFLVLSMISNPLYFDLRQIKNEDLNKEIILKIIPFDGEKKMKNKQEYDSAHSCTDDKDERVTFKVTRSNSERPKN